MLLSLEAGVSGTRFEHAAGGARLADARAGLSRPTVYSSLHFAHCRSHISRGTHICASEVKIITVEAKL